MRVRIIGISGKDLYHDYPVIGMEGDFEPENCDYCPNCIHGKYGYRMGAFSNGERSFFFVAIRIEELHECTTCGGTGVFTLPAFWKLNQETCNLCKGTGYAK